MAKPWKVLVFPGGTEIGLEINSALRDCKEIELYSAGMDTSSHAPFVFIHHDIVPEVTDHTWLAELNRVIRTRSIDFVIPAHDDAMLALARDRKNIEAHVLCSPLETCEIARSKTATYRHLEGSVAVPTLYQELGQIRAYPVFVKPDRGQGSQGARPVVSREELDLAIRGDAGLIVSEFLPGEEYTVDCFSDRDRGLLFCSGRRRDRIRTGISVSTRRVENSQFRQMAEHISQRMVFHGAWFFQLKRAANGDLKLLEVAPRIAGAMALHRVIGVNFALLTIFEALRMPFEVVSNQLDVRLDRAFLNRYAVNLNLNNIYLDLDDTLLVHGQVNLALIRLVFQCINKNVRVVLITRHAGDLGGILQKHRLQGLFDRIVHLQAGEPKSAAIDDTDGAVLIDDSFKERLEVHMATGILTFDNSMIEALQDYRA